MPQSLARVVLHVVFSTKNRVPFLKDTELCARLHAFMAGVLQKIGCEPILINGTEDHVHILCNLSRTITIADMVEKAKKSPSKWMKKQGPAYGDFFWQGGYGAFSVSQSNVEQVRAYIATQEEHHRKVSLNLHHSIGNLFRFVGAYGLVWAGTQGGARSSLALGWLVDGPLARGDAGEEIEFKGERLDLSSLWW